MAKHKEVSERRKKLMKKFPYQLSEWMIDLVELEPMVGNLEKHRYPYCVIENIHGEFAVFTSGKKIMKEKKRASNTVRFAKNTYKE